MLESLIYYVNKQQPVKQGVKACYLKFGQSQQDEFGRKEEDT